MKTSYLAPNIFLLTFSLITFFNLYGQDTIRLNKKPNFILKSWYPEFKEFPTLKINEGKILFTYLADHKTSKLYNNDINLKPNNAEVEIIETEKPNQYLVNVLKANDNFVKFELWLELGNVTILIKEKNIWKNAINIYPYKENRIMIQKIKLNLSK